MLTTFVLLTTVSTVFRINEQIQLTGKIENLTRVELSRSVSRRDGRKIQKSVDKNLFKSNEHSRSATHTDCNKILREPINATQKYV